MSEATAEEAQLEVATDDEPTYVEVDHAPPRQSQIMTVAAALIGAALTAPFSALSIPFGISGLIIVIISVFVKYSRSWLTIGVAMILAGALISGLYGVVPAEVFIVGVGATIIAWDAGQHGIVIGNQIGRQAPIQRSLFIHVAATTLVIGLIGGLVYAIFLVGGTGRPSPAVAMTIIGVIILGWVLRS